MNIFQEVKSEVSTKDAAALYGIKVGRNKMACCPFHPDKHPSMKVDNRFHCFGCGANRNTHGYRPVPLRMTDLRQ